MKALKLSFPILGTHATDTVFYGPMGWRPHQLALKLLQMQGCNWLCSALIIMPRQRQYTQWQ